MKFLRQWHRRWRGLSDEWEGIQNPAPTGALLLCPTFSRYTVHVMRRCVVGGGWRDDGADWLLHFHQSNPGAAMATMAAHHHQVWNEIIMQCKASLSIQKRAV